MRIDDFATALKGAGVRHGAGVPCSFFTPLVNHMAADPEMAYVSAASEGEAVAIAAGLTAAGCPAFALMQNSGLGNAVNPITSLLTTYEIPALLLVSHRGQPGLEDAPQHALMGEITEQLADLCGLRTHVLAEDGAGLEQQLAAARGTAGPTAWICRKGHLSGGPDAPRRELLLRAGGTPSSQAATFAPELSREAALRALLPLLNGHHGVGHQGEGHEGAGVAADAPAVIATTGKTSRELYELDDRDHDKRNRFYMVGSMGCAAGFGLGVARALASRGERRRVVVLDGDGALMMKLGTLTTIGQLGEGTRGICHVLLDNGAHDSTGGQHTASPGVDFAAIAAACGYRRAETVASADAIAPTLASHLADEGPTFLRVAVRVGARKDLGRPTFTPPAGYARFCAFLAGEGTAST